MVKNYSENEGLLELFEKEGYITNPKEVSFGFVNMYVADKTQKLIDLEKETLTIPKKMKP